MLSPEYVRVVNRKRWTLPSQYASAAELADFFHTPNLVFFHSEHHRAELLKELRGADRLLCNVGDPLTIGDAEKPAEKARGLSELSQSFPNVVGGIVDDFSMAINDRRMSVPWLEKVHAALKSHNQALQLQAVVYADDLRLDLSAYLPHLDTVGLWVWKARDLGRLDEYLERAGAVFPGKPIYLGLYLYDYGDQCDTLPLDLVQYEFERAKRYLEAGRIAGLQVLGSYMRAELQSEPARWAADFLAKLIPPGMPGAWGARPGERA